MMYRNSRKSEGKPLKLAIEEFIRTFRLEDKLSEKKILYSWENVVGEMVSKHTRRISIRNGTLYVALDSAALRSELFYLKEKIIMELNREAGRKVIDEVVFQ